MSSKSTIRVARGGEVPLHPRATRNVIECAIAPCIESLEQRLCFSASTGHTHGWIFPHTAGLMFQGPRAPAGYHFDLAHHGDAESHDASHHEHRNGHHHHRDNGGIDEDEDDVDGDSDGEVDGGEVDGGEVDGGEVDGGEEGDGGEEEEVDLQPVRPIVSAPDGAGALNDPSATSAVTGTSWNFIGPGASTSGSTINSGRITGIAAHPTDPNTIYVAAAGGGVWKTTNGGSSWLPLTDAQSTLFMGSIAIAPSDPNTIYAGTGEANNSADSYYGRGILKSTDAGATWTLMGNVNFDRRAIAKIAVDPTNPNTIYAAVGGFPVNGVGGNRGIWRSTDGGVSWTNTTTGISTTANFSDLVIDPSTPQTLYCAVGTYNGSSVNGVYKSTNGGGSWSAAGDFGVGAANGRITLALAPSSPQTLYASVTNPSSHGLGRMMVTTNGGTNWTQLANTPNNLGSQGWYDVTLIVDPSDSHVVYAGGAATGSTHVMKTTDGGATWSGITNVGGAPHVDHHAIAFDAGGRLLDGNDGGIWRLTNPNVGSIAWADLNANLGTLLFQGIAIHPTNSAIAYGGTQDNGTLKYNNSSVWTTSAGGDGGEVLVSPSTPTVLYHIAPVASFGSSAYIQRSDNSGANWINKTSGITAGEPTNFYPPLAIDPTDGTRVFTGTNRVYMSNNSGDSWLPISTPGASGWTMGTSNTVDVIAPSATDPNVIYVAIDGATFVTTNGGATWTQRNVTGATDHVADLIVDPTNSSIAYAARDKFGGGRVFRTVDGGATWSDISGDLPDSPANALALDVNGPGSGDDVLYVGDDLGVYASDDTGATWSRFGAGLPNAIVLDLEFSPALELLAAGTHGRGVWETSTAVGTPGSGSIAGTIFTDINGNGTLDTVPSTEPGINGTLPNNSITVFIDSNNNGVFETGEPTTTNSSSGTFSFTGLADGTYTVRVTDPSTSLYVRTSAASVSATISGGSAVIGKNFGYWPTTYSGTSASDSYIIKLDATGTKLQITEGATQYSIDKNMVASVRFNPGFGDDTFDIMYVNGDPVPPNGINIDGAAGSTIAGDRITLNGASGNDAVTITDLDVVSGSGAIAIRNIERVTMFGNGGNDSLTMNAEPALLESSFDGGSGTDTLTYNGADITETLTLNSGSIVNGAWTTSMSAIEALALDTRGGNDTINVAAASVATTVGGGDGNDTLNLNATPAAAFIFNGGTNIAFGDTFNLNTGSYAFGVDANVGTFALTVNLAGNTNATFNSSQHLYALSIGSGAVATLAPGANKVLVTSALTIAGTTDAWTGKLDLKDNDMVFRSTGGTRAADLTRLDDQIAQGFNRNGSLWAGTGITTSLGGDVAHTFGALGIAINDKAQLRPAGNGPLYSSFSAQTVGVNDILVKYTYFGDADLDGVVTTNDYFQVDTSFISAGSTGWLNGDFDYAGNINTNDYFAIDNAFLGQGAPM